MLKIGDFVAAKHSLGKVVEVNDTQVVIEVPDHRKETGVRPVKITLEQAQKLGKTLEEALALYVQKVELVND